MKTLLTIVVAGGLLATTYGIVSLGGPAQVPLPKALDVDTKLLEDINALALKYDLFPHQLMDKIERLSSESPRLIKGGLGVIGYNTYVTPQSKSNAILVSTNGVLNALFVTNDLPNYLVILGNRQIIADFALKNSQTNELIFVLFNTNRIDYYHMGLSSAGFYVRRRSEP